MIKWAVLFGGVMEKRLKDRVKLGLVSADTQSIDINNKLED